METKPLEDIESFEPRKKENTKEKKIIPKRFLGNDITKLPKTKSLLKDIDKVPTLTLEQTEKYLTAIVLGMVPDKFGLEVGVDTKIKALQELTKVQNIKLERDQANDEEKDQANALDIVYKVREVHSKQSEDNDNAESDNN